MISGKAPEATHEFINELRAAIPEVHFDRLTRLLYSTDASIYQMVPIGVAFPRDEDEIAAAVEIAAKHRLPILPRGGGSSLAGQAIGHALILDLSRYLNRIVEVDPQAKTVCAQAGVTLDEVNRAAGQFGLMFAPDPASADRATVGGSLGNNASGAHSILFGMAVDHTLSTEVVLVDGSQVQFEAVPRAAWNAYTRRPGLEGSIYRAIPAILDHYAEPIATRYPRTFRNVAGYNLNKLADAKVLNLSSLLVGSEGTLGVITQATLKLVPIPKEKRLALVHYNTLKAALEAVPELLESSPAAIEIIDHALMELTRNRIEYHELLTFIQGEPKAVLLVEYTADTDKELDNSCKRLQAKLSQLRHRQPVVILEKPGDQAKVWDVRKVGLGILMSMRGDTKPVTFIEDAAVPVEHLAEYVNRMLAYADELGVEKVALYGHASAGCLHLRPLINLKTARGVQQMRLLAEKSVELVIKYGGTTSGEHGEGFSRGEFSERLFGADLVEAFRRVKQAFDPHNLMNPGKVVDAPPMDDETQLRYGSCYATPYEPRKTMFSFRHDGSLARAVEMCNGAGVCRQLGQGVMCPSFQATRDEALSTRGRANALRAAMMGLLDSEGFTSHELHAILDLCLSCQACKAECPSGVDMAKLKAEFLYAYYKENGIPLRAWLLGHIAALNKIAQPIAPLANLFLAAIGKPFFNALGIHPQRTLPQLAMQSFSKWYRQRDRRPQPANITGNQTVILFHDTFMEHYEPQIGQAAVKVLEAAGYEVRILPNRQCCGRPAVSKGLLDEAARLARHNLGLLAPYAGQHIPIVGCEPSCMAMLVDEYIDLIPGAEAEAVANMAMTIEQFLIREAEKGSLNLSFDEMPRRVLFHGHCQQKANFGTRDTLTMLRLVPNCQVEEIEAGCCGMAGSFGYEREHYDLSIQLAEMALAPTIRAATPETIICATGSSCRQQIEHTTGRRALHPIQVLAGALHG